MNDDPLEELREAAGAVVSSLEQLAAAAAKIIADPEAFASVVDNGRAIVEAFVGGFLAEATDRDETAHREDFGSES